MWQGPVLMNILKAYDLGFVDGMLKEKNEIRMLEPELIKLICREVPEKIDKDFPEKFAKDIIELLKCHLKVDKQE